MPIHPLPQFEADLRELQEEDRKIYEALKAPKTLVVRFGAMKLVGEFPYDGSVKPGCGTKLVVRTHRGTELGEMLTSTCPNSGCSKSVSRQEMLQYIENSGGRDYPFTTEGRVLRVATVQDLEQQQRIEQSKHGLKMQAREVTERLELPIKIVDAEPILGGERLTFFFLSEDRVDFRDLVRELGMVFRARIELRQVGARDEARLTADYEKCGQYCCCKNFLKVLKPVSMKSAKVQKATLDPLKISGRCGRLMCCLRYEDQTYADLAARLPRKKTRVGTPEGDGFVVDTQILTQLVLVQLDGPPEAEIKQIAIAVEELTEAGLRPPPPSAPPPAQQRSGRDRGPDQGRGGPGSGGGGNRPPGGGGGDRGGDRGGRGGGPPSGSGPQGGRDSRPRPGPGAGPGPNSSQGGGPRQDARGNERSPTDPAANAPSSSTHGSSTDESVTDDGPSAERTSPRSSDAPDVSNGDDGSEFMEGGELDRNDEAGGEAEVQGDPSAAGGGPMSRGGGNGPGGAGGPPRHGSSRGGRRRRRRGRPPGGDQPPPQGPRPPMN